MLQVSLKLFDSQPRVSPIILYLNNEGKFINVRSSLYGDAFVAEMSLETIQVSENGRYSLRYFFFTYCNNSECQSAADFIQINVITQSSMDGEESSQQVDTSKVNLNEITLERRWLEREMIFHVNMAPATLKVALDNFVSCLSDNFCL